MGSPIRRVETWHTGSARIHPAAGSLEGRSVTPLSHKETPAITSLGKKLTTARSMPTAKGLEERVSPSSEASPVLWRVGSAVSDLFRLGSSPSNLPASTPHSRQKVRRGAFDDGKKEVKTVDFHRRVLSRIMALSGTGAGALPASSPDVGAGAFPPSPPDVGAGALSSTPPEVGTGGKSAFGPAPRKRATPHPEAGAAVGGGSPLSSIDEEKEFEGANPMYLALQERAKRGEELSERETELLRRFCESSPELVMKAYEEEFVETQQKSLKERLGLEGRTTSPFASQGVVNPIIATAMQKIKHKEELTPTETETVDAFLTAIGYEGGTIEFDEKGALQIAIKRDAPIVQSLAWNMVDFAKSFGKDIAYDTAKTFATVAVTAIITSAITLAILSLA